MNAEFYADLESVESNAKTAQKKIPVFTKKEEKVEFFCIFCCLPKVLAN